MLRLDQKGVSLPLVLAILGLVIANTYYFMDVEKSTKEQNIKRGSELEDNSEKLRLASFLSDVKVCSSDNSPALPALGVGNTGFGRRTIAEINTLGGPIGSEFSLKKDNIEFLKLGDVYARGSLKFLKYQIVLTNPSSPSADISKNYSLLVTYSLVDRLTKVASATRTKVIRLPLYIVFESGNPANKIVTCYTEADETLGTVSTTVQKACNGTAALVGTNATNGLTECQHNINNQTCTNSEVLIGVQANANKEDFVCGHPENKATTSQKCPQTPMREFLSDLRINDEFVCRSTETGCNDGQMFVMGASGSPVCVTNCNVNQLFKSVGASGTPNCLNRPDQCPVGQYSKEIRANGTVNCQPYTYLNKSCSPGYVATDVDIAAGESASGDAAFHCRLITKKKVCAEPTTVTTFVRSLATVVPTCQTF